MKKFAGLIFLAVGVLAIITLFFLTLNSSAQVRAIAQSKGTHYEEMLVVMQNRTYQQLLKSNDDGSIVVHEGTWIPANEMPEAEKMLGKKKAEKVVAFNDKLDTNTGKRPQLAFEEAASLETPDEGKLKLWQEWKAKADGKLKVENGE